MKQWFRMWLTRFIGVDYLHKMQHEQGEALFAQMEDFRIRLKALEDAYLLKVFPKPEPEPERGLMGGFVPHSVKKKRMERALAQSTEPKK